MLISRPADALRQLRSKWDKAVEDYGYCYWCMEPRDIRHGWSVKCRSCGREKKVASLWQMGILTLLMGPLAFVPWMDFNWEIQQVRMQRAREEHNKNRSAAKPV